MLEELRAFGSDTPEPTDAATAAARAHLLAAIAAAPAVTRARAQRSRRLILAASLASALLLAAGLVGLRTAANPPSALAAQLGRLATVAASQKWSGIPRAGQYLYTESEGLVENGAYANGQVCDVEQVQHRRIWIATDGAGALSEREGPPQFASAADRAICEAMPAGAAGAFTDANSFRPGGLSFPTRDWHALATDPATLLKQIHHLDGGPNTPAEWFVNVGDFLRESDAPPAIRAALYRAAALIPGVGLLGLRTDPAGQTGLAVSFPWPDGQIHLMLIFDPQTARLVGEEDYDQHGALAGWTAYLQSKIVDSHPAYPLSN